MRLQSFFPHFFSFLFTQRPQYVAWRAVGVVVLVVIVIRVLHLGLCLPSCVGLAPYTHPIPLLLLFPVLHAKDQSSSTSLSLSLSSSSSSSRSTRQSLYPSCWAGTCSWAHASDSCLSSSSPSSCRAFTHSLIHSFPPTSVNHTHTHTHAYNLPTRPVHAYTHIDIHTRSSPFSPATRF